MSIDGLSVTDYLRDTPSLLLSPAGRRVAYLEGLAPMSTEEERFWAMVQTGDGCWPWMGTINSAGYGRFLGPGGLDKLAHRVSYELQVGPVPSGLELDHLCRNPPCVNPAHLEPVTHRENILRGVSIVARNAKVTHCPQGHPYSGDNLYLSPQGRRCRACHKAHQARYLQRIVGHRDLATTRRYVGRTPNAMGSAAATLDRAMG